MTALVAVTLGNSNAAAALVTDDALGPVRRTPVAQLGELSALLARACPDCGGEAVPVVVSSVNPPALDRVGRLLAGMSLPAPLLAREDFPIPLRNETLQPDRVGADRLLGALAAYRRVGAPCVVVDAGTAITVNAVRSDGAFLGGAIFPGLAMMARALAEGTALLPTVAPAADVPLVGKSTEQAIAVGIRRGAAGAVAGLIAAARQTVGPGARVVLTGGDAERLAEFLPPDCRLTFPNLVLEGLVFAYREWQKR